MLSEKQDMELRAFPLEEPNNIEDEDQPQFYEVKFRASVLHLKCAKAEMKT